MTPFDHICQARRQRNHTPKDMYSNQPTDNEKGILNPAPRDQKPQICSVESFIPDVSRNKNVTKGLLVVSGLRWRRFGAGLCGLCGLCRLCVNGFIRFSCNSYGPEMVELLLPETKLFIREWRFKRRCEIATTIDAFK